MSITLNWRGRVSRVVQLSIVMVLILWTATIGSVVRQHKEVVARRVPQSVDSKGTER
jgi:hypothetical protein